MNAWPKNAHAAGVARSHRLRLVHRAAVSGLSFALLAGLLGVACPPDTDGNIAQQMNAGPGQSVPGASGSGADASSQACPDAANPPADRQAVVDLLSALRDELSAAARQDVRAAVDDYAAGFPVDAPQDQAIRLDGQLVGEQVAIDVQPGRRDWAYAVHGMAFTLAGSDPQQGGPWLDLALWCYAEAAVLQPDEVEHLVNVAFHLNLRQRYEDARLVLAYARSLDPENLAVADNLAYAAEHLRQWDCAIRLLRDEVLDRGLLDADVVARLGEALRQVGRTVEADAVDGLIPGRDSRTRPSSPSSTPPPSAALSERAIELNAQLWDLWGHGGYAAETSDVEMRFVGRRRPQKGCDVVGLDPETQNILLAHQACIEANGGCDCDVQREEAFLAHSVASAAHNSALALERDAALQNIQTRYRAELLSLIAGTSGLTQSDRDWLADFWLAQVQLGSSATHAGTIEGIAGFEQCVEMQRDALRTQMQICELLPAPPPARPVFVPWSASVGIVSLSMGPDGTLTLTVGQGVQVFGQFNIVTRDWALGGGLGVSFAAPFAGKMFRAQAYFKVRPLESVELGAKLSWGTPTDPRGGVKTGSTLLNPRLVLLRNARPTLPDTGGP